MDRPEDSALRVSDPLESLHQNLRIARRQLIDDISQTFESDRVIPDLGKLNMLSSVQIALDAVEALRIEDQRG